MLRSVAANLFARYNKLPQPKHYVSYEDTVNVETDDGIMLSTDHYYPSTADLTRKDFPALVCRTSYGGAAHQSPMGMAFSSLCYYYASQGYHVILQSARGTFSSGGDEFVPAMYEGRDGAALIRWLAQKEWFDVHNYGTIGASYLGFSQFAILANAEHLPAASVIEVGPTNFYDTTYGSGAFNMEICTTWSLMMHEMQGMRNNAGMFRNYRSMWSAGKKLDKAIPQLTMHSPFNEADKWFYGKNVTPLQCFVKNSSRDDEFWRLSDQAAGLDRMDGDKVHLITGWYDCFMERTLADYQYWRSKGKNPYLTIGDCSHGGNLILNISHTLQWLNTKLKHPAANGVDPNAATLRQEKVEVQVGHSKRWIKMNEWPPATETVNWFLAANEQLSLSPIASDAEKLVWKYTYDPLKPTPIFYGNLLADKAGTHDNTEFVRGRVSEFKDMIMFKGPAIQKSLVIAGQSSVNLQVSSTLNHFDLFLRFLDFDPTKNTLMNICDGFLRISPQNQPKKLENGSFEVEIQMNDILYDLEAGHHLCLCVSSGAHPYRARNPGTGEPISTATEFVSSTQQIFADSVVARSRIKLRVLRE